MLYSAHPAYGGTWQKRRAHYGKVPVDAPRASTSPTQVPVGSLMDAAQAAKTKEHEVPPICSSGMICASITLHSCLKVRVASSQKPKNKTALSSLFMTEMLPKCGLQTTVHKHACKSCKLVSDIPRAHIYTVSQGNSGKRGGRERAANTYLRHFHFSKQLGEENGYTD